ncbi:MAG: hypothetical protein EBY81_05575 [Verrucomicrobia bacterium]|nr:hypothetical protein [Verrucomicrobiota bacterium]NDI17115.1 hypothetical protein [Verrucomicrobiota bacterium]
MGNHRLVNLLLLTLLYKLHKLMLKVILLVHYKQLQRIVSINKHLTEVYSINKQVQMLKVILFGVLIKI